MDLAVPLLVLSHQRWRSAPRRTQEIVTRLALGRRVLFVEEPVFETGPAGLTLMDPPRTPAGRVRVCRPYTPLREAGFGEQQNAALAPLLLDLLRREGFESFVAWLDTPAATSLARWLGPVALCYDCGDDLAGFHGTPSMLAAQERELLDSADLVVTATPGLQRAKRDLHRSIHCLPNGVDVDAFAPRPERPEPEDQAAFAHPRLGCFAPIDERIDLPLIEAVAAAHPDWTVVLVGPVSTLDPETLPRRPNVKYLGPRPHAELPRYAAGWDVALMPFAVHRPLRGLGVARSLEYMAAERPIVSTPIADALDAFERIAHVGDGVTGFVEACERALATPEDERGARIRRGHELLARTSWDLTATRLDALIAGLADRSRALVAGA